MKLRDDAITATKLQPYATSQQQSIAAVLEAQEAALGGNDAELGAGSPGSGANANSTPSTTAGEGFGVPITGAGAGALAAQSGAFATPVAVGTFDANVAPGHFAPPTALDPYVYSVASPLGRTSVSYRIP